MNILYGPYTRKNTRSSYIYVNLSLPGKENQKHNDTPPKKKPTKQKPSLPQGGWRGNVSGFATDIGSISIYTVTCFELLERQLKFGYVSEVSSVASKFVYCYINHMQD